MENDLALECHLEIRPMFVFISKTQSLELPILGFGTHFPSTTANFGKWEALFGMTQVIKYTTMTKTAKISGTNHILYSTCVYY